MNGVHCFDCTDVAGLVNELVPHPTETAQSLSDLLHLVFLPAPRTWIEIRTPDENRGYYLEQCSGTVGQFRDPIGFTLFGGNKEQTLIAPVGFIDPATGKTFSPKESGYITSSVQFPNEVMWSINLSRVVIAMLAIINSPSIILRDTHPSRKTLRQKTKNAFDGGKFEIRAWHEIKLKVNSGVADASGQQREFTGTKALHFCRKYIRIRRGRLEYVRSHWRGDPSKGIAPATYKVH